MDSYWDGGGYLVAEYDKEELDAVADEVYLGLAFWSHHSQGSMVNVPYDREAIAKRGLFPYLRDHGITSDRNKAKAIANLARDAGLNQVQFMNWAAEFIPDVTGPEPRPGVGGRGLYMSSETD